MERLSLREVSHSKALKGTPLTILGLTRGRGAEWASYTIANTNLNATFCANLRCSSIIDSIFSQIFVCNGDKGRRKFGGQEACTP